MTTDEVLTRFAAEHFERHSISRGRRRDTLTVLRSLAASQGPLLELTPSQVMAWQGAELSRGIKPNSMRNYETMLRAFAGWAYQAGLMTHEHLTQLKSVHPVRGSVNGKPKPYKRAEVERFREQLAERYPLAPMKGRGSQMLKRYLRGKSRPRAVVYNHAKRLQLEAQVSLTLEEGLRVGELHALTLDRLHPDNAAVVVRTLKSKPGEERDREVPWTGHSRACVADWLNFRAQLAPSHDAPWLHLWWDGFLDPMTYMQLKDSGLLGFPGYSWHRFRHTFATERLRAGVSLEVVQVMMGHASLEQTLAYAQIVSADVTTQADRTEEAFLKNLGLEGA